MPFEKQGALLSRTVFYSQGAGEHLESAKIQANCRGFFFFSILNWEEIMKKTFIKVISA